jgi:hypothetical protein
VTNSQLFAFDGGAGPLSLQPQNQDGSCLVVKDSAIDIADCNNSDASQSFTLGGAAANGGNSNGNTNGGNAGESTSTCTKSTRTVTVQPTQSTGKAAAPETTLTATLPFQNKGNAAVPTATFILDTGDGDDAGTGDIPTANPTDPVPVSRAGGRLQPTAAAESHERDETATRAFSSVEIRAPNGQCLFVDPTAGDFRQNLIPVSLVDCSGSPNEKWDIITEGKHNKPNPNRPATLVVSALVSPTAWGYGLLRGRHGLT